MGKVSSPKYNRLCSISVPVTYIAPKLHARVSQILNFLLSTENMQTEGKPGRQGKDNSVNTDKKTRYQLTGGEVSNHQGRGIKAVLQDRMFLSPYLDDHDANGEYVVRMKHFTKSYHKKYLLMEVFSINNLKGFLTDSHVVFGNIPNL